VVSFLTRIEDDDSGVGKDDKADVLNNLVSAGMFLSQGIPLGKSSITGNVIDAVNGDSLGTAQIFLRLDNNGFPSTASGGNNQIGRDLSFLLCQTCSWKLSLICCTPGISRTPTENTTYTLTATGQRESVLFFLKVKIVTDCRTPARQLLYTLPYQRQPSARTSIESFPGLSRPPPGPVKTVPGHPLNLIEMRLPAMEHRWYHPPEQ
jgi:hypothetical protein